MKLKECNITEVGYFARKQCCMNKTYSSIMAAALHVVKDELIKVKRHVSHSVCMQAVENRLYYMQEKLQECETVIKELKTHEMEREMKKKAEEDPTQLVDSLRSRLLLLENRVKLLESKVWSVEIKSAGQRSPQYTLTILNKE